MSMSMRLGLAVSKYASVFGYMLRKRLLHDIADSRVENRDTKTIAFLEHLLEARDIEHIETTLHDKQSTAQPSPRNFRAILRSHFQWTLPLPAFHCHYAFHSKQRWARFSFRFPTIRPNNQCFACGLQLRQKFGAKKLSWNLHTWFYDCRCDVCGWLVWRCRSNWVLLFYED